MMITARGRLIAIARYFKRAGLDVHVERGATSEIYLMNAFALVKVAMHPVTKYTTFDPDWERATFVGAKAPASHATWPDQKKRWDQHMAAEFHPVTLTHELYEVPAGRQGGVLFRKFIRLDEDGNQYTSLFSKDIMDILSPDLDELETFQFEQVGERGPMRITATDGYVAFAMPAIR